MLALLGSAYVYLGRVGEAGAILGEAHEILSASDRTKSLTLVMNERGALAVLLNDLDEARRCCAVALDLARTLKDVGRENIALANLGEVEFRRGALDRAIEYARESIQGRRAFGPVSFLGRPLVNLASYLILRGDHAEARAHAGEALPLLREEGGYWLRLCLLQWAVLGAFDGRYAAAGQILGYFKVAHADSREVLQPLDHQMCDLLSTLLAAHLSADDLAIRTDDGARWTETLAVDFALKRLVPPARSPAP